MRILVTGDFQADWQNLDLCEQAWLEILEIAVERKLTAIVVAGDLKRVYNPVDVRMVKWWRRAIKRAKQLGLDVIVVLGNHDRVGQYTDTDNWFPILQDAGAIAVHQEAREVYVRGGQLMCLPFCRDKEELHRRAKVLAEQATQHSAVLIFHEDLKGCKYNKLGQRSGVGIDTEWLCADKYRYVVGGHVHLHQKLGQNIYYAGSPFSQDWGEANQRKGYVCITDEGLEFLPSKIPGWFDETWPGFYEPESWAGTRIRIHAKCNSAADYVARVEHLRRDAEARYKGAEIYVNAVFAGDEREVGHVGITAAESDERKIREYVRQTCPENLDHKAVTEYLVSKLEEVGGRWVRSGTGVEFLGAKAKNFLGYKELEVRFNQKGIILVQGTNKDRAGKSNGSGKTSLLQTIPVAWFGTTFKGQKHDRWARRNAEGAATVQLVVRDAKGRKLTVIRGRRPPLLKLYVDGKDQSTGMRSQEKDATQGAIEQVTGFTWETLANAVYIDQEVSRAFIAGTKRERTSVLSRFQNLERFEKVGVTVRKERAASEERGRQLQTEIGVISERIQGTRRRLSVLLEESEARVREACLEVRKREETKLQAEAELEPKLEWLQARSEKLFTRAEELREQNERHDWALAQVQGVRARGKGDLLKLTQALELSECPMCMQRVDKELLKTLVRDTKAQIAQIEKAIEAAEETCKGSAQVAALAEADAEMAQRKVNKVEEQLRMERFAFEETEKQYREMRRREHLESDARQEAKQELVQAIKKKKLLEAEQIECRHEQEFLRYAEKAVSRDGIPAFLNALLCPQLNVAAEYYAELFADKALQVRFEMENGEFVPVILNATGGEAIDDQSRGEAALAGLIGSFALREVAPKCNLLILDEPGDGLDPLAARQFAVALRTLKQKFGSIWVMTHNPAIQQELADEQVVQVVKHHGVSYVVE